jgi:hypothetical protein
MDLSPVSSFTQRIFHHNSADLVLQRELMTGPLHIHECVRLSEGGNVQRRRCTATIVTPSEVVTEST